MTLLDQDLSGWHRSRPSNRRARAARFWLGLIRALQAAQRDLAQ